jgi:hypothetical protein
MYFIVLVVVPMKNVTDKDFTMERNRARRLDET